MKATFTPFAFALGIFFLSASGIHAQTPDPTSYVDYIKSQKSPAQLKSMVETASPSAWKLIQERAKAGPGATFNLSDFQNLPENERQALLQAFLPLVKQAQAQGAGGLGNPSGTATANPGNVAKTSGLLISGIKTQSSSTYSNKRYY